MYTCFFLSFFFLFYFFIIFFLYFWKMIALHTRGEVMQVHTGSDFHAVVQNYRMGAVVENGTLKKICKFFFKFKNYKNNNN
jgi:hypothetical protein